MLKMTGQIHQTLVAQAVPEAKAKAMAQSIWKGLGLILIGLLLLAGAFAMVYFLVLKLQKEPGLTTGALILGTAGLGVFFIVGGGNAMSGQALDAAASSPIFGVVAKAVRLWKPKPPA